MCTSACKRERDREIGGEIERMRARDDDDNMIEWSMLFIIKSDVLSSFVVSTAADAGAAVVVQLIISCNCFERKHRSQTKENSRLFAAHI